MKYLKKSAVLAIIAALCVILTSCGGSSESDDDVIVGGDWRTTGVVSAFGTIRLDGRSTDVCVCVHDDGAVLYYDKAEQELFYSIDYPVLLPDAPLDFSEISFDDVTGDAQSDVRMEFVSADGEVSTLVWFWEDGSGYVYQPWESAIAGYEEADISQYTGLWEYLGENIWLNIYDDAAWTFVNSDGEVVYSGVALPDTGGVELHYDENGDIMRLVLTDPDVLYDAVNNGSLVRVDSANVSTPYFEEHSLDMNAAADAGEYVLPNGVCFYTDGEYYTGDCYWEVEILSNVVHDGIREIEFDARCAISEDAAPYMTEDYTTSTTSELYDYNTGTWLTASGTWADSQRGENHYVHTIDWNGKSYEIEFFYSTSWDEQQEGFHSILTKSYVVYLPEDYAGLVFAAEAQADNAEDNTIRMELEEHCPEYPIMDCETVDPYANLYFYIY